MIKRELKSYQLDDLLDNVLSLWEENENEYILLWDLDIDSFRIAKRSGKQDLTEYEILYPYIMSYVKDSDLGPDWELSENEEENGPSDPENLTALKEWLKKEFGQIEIDDSNLIICSHCHSLIKQDGSTPSHRLEKPDSDGLEFICSECFCNGDYIEDLEENDFIARPIEDYIQEEKILNVPCMSIKIPNYSEEKMVEFVITGYGVTSLYRQDVLVKDSKLKIMAKKKVDQFFEEMVEKKIPSISPALEQPYRSLLYNWLLGQLRDIKKVYLSK